MIDIWPIETDDRKEIIEYFGEPGDNLVPIDCPFPLRLSWSPDKTINRFYCHGKVKDSFYRVFKNVLLHYGQARIEELGLNQFGGCYSMRNQRGGNRLSVHSWGIAIDIDPINNALNWDHRKSRLALPVYDYFWHFVGQEGLCSLGHSIDRDWMHFQAAKR